ncbi:MAG TPA: NAD(P)/FAD-dependent oxidoreductase [Sandaracinaceae bacterium LLY-WYZ-13_1]|nr:NAD(P)/FAD-dependent oxidoreductase [Sandaracinaceae bacterium LLY-WYZ-13_1]
MTARSYKRQTPKGPWDAIVIRSGMGGLTAAALLAKHGERRVLVLERHYTPGGFTHVFKRPGYEWDVGVHYIGGIEGREQLGALFDTVTGGRVRWARMPDCYDRVFVGGRPHDLVAGRRRFVETLSEAFPGRRADLEAYLELVQRSAGAGAPFFAERLLSPRVSRWIGAPLRAPLRRWSDRTVEEVVRPLARDPVLFDVLTGQCGDYGLTPREASFAIHAMVVGHYLGGAWYPVGGPGTLAEGAAEVIARGGGELYTNAEVEAIEMEGGRAVGVRTTDGRVHRAPAVISDAGAMATYLRLLPREVANATGLPPKLRAVGPSTGHLCLHLGFRETDDALGLDGTNLWVYAPGDREERFARFSEDPSEPIPVAYISFPSAKDPSFQDRYPGRATVEVITLARMAWFERWARTRWMKRGEAYEDFKRDMTERLLAILFEHRPQLRGKVDHAELSSPLSTEHFTGHAEGAMYGLAHTPARFRLPLHAETEVPGLYLAGSDLASCGVAGALFGGALAAGAVLRRELPGRLRSRVFGGLRRSAAREPAPATEATPKPKPRART